MHNTVLRASSEYVANHFSDGYVVWQIGNRDVCVNQAENVLTMSGLAGIKALRNFEQSKLIFEFLWPSH